MVESLRDPSPAPIVQPASLSALTTVFEALPSGSLRHDTVQLRRPSRGTYGTPRCSLHASTRARIASWRRQRASTPPSRSMRASWVSSAYNSEIAGVLVGWCLVVACTKLTRSKYSPRFGRVLARSSIRSDATPSASPGGRRRADEDGARSAEQPGERLLEPLEQPLHRARAVADHRALHGRQDVRMHVRRAGQKKAPERGRRHAVARASASTSPSSTISFVLISRTPSSPHSRSSCSDASRSIPRIASVTTNKRVRGRRSSKPSTAALSHTSVATP